MRTPSERLAEINKRADARIAAIQKRNRTIAGACTTLAMCLAIALGAHRMLSVPDVPPLVPPEHTTISSTSTATQSTDTTASVIVSTSTDNPTTSTSPSKTDVPMYVTVTTTDAIASTTTATTPSFHTTSRVTTANGITAATTNRPTGVSSQTVTTSTLLATTTTECDGSDNNDPSPPSDDFTTTTRPDWSGGDIQSPPSDDYTTTTRHATTTTTDWGFQGGGTNPPPTTTTTAVLAGNVVFSVSSFEDVSVGDEITVEVTVSDFHYIVSGEVYIQYDPDVLQLQAEVSSAPPEIFNGAYAMSLHCPSEGDMELRFTTSSIVGSTQGGTLLRLTFKVRKGFHDSTTILCEIPQMISNNGIRQYDTPVTVINGTIASAESGYDFGYNLYKEEYLCYEN